jgi:hypothetical protein
LWGGQIASVIAVVGLLEGSGSASFQAACAGYLATFLLVLTPGMFIGWRRTLRDPKRGAALSARAAVALLGSRRRTDR